MMHLILASLRHYRATHAMVVAGIAVAVSVLAGALLVGASVRASLRDLALGRLGNTGVVISSPTFFRQQFGDALGGPSVIAITGSIENEDTGRIASRVQIFGIDDGFARFHGVTAGAPTARQAWMSTALARELGATTPASLIVRVAKPTDIPLSTLQGRRDEAGERIRVTGERIVDRASMGDFSLLPQQGPALTLFVARDRLQRDLELTGRVNVVLLPASTSTSLAAVLALVQEKATLEDYGLRVRTSPTSNTVIVESRTGLIPPPLASVLQMQFGMMGAEPVLTHLANVIAVGGREIPYSLITARPMKTPSTGEPALVLNEWAASDLGARIGDPGTLSYYVWSDESGLTTGSLKFVVAAVEPMSGLGGDPTFTPDYPGLTDADDVTAWDPPFPVDMTRVRKQDEDYWDTYRGAPKAFIPIELGQRLWGSVHGNVSSIRIPVPAGANREAFAAQLERDLSISPGMTGLTVRDVRSDALTAADGTVDFGEYFVYFSFFIVVSGLLLAGLFFALSVEQRAREAGILGAVGFEPARIRRLLLLEGAVLGGIGAAIGVVGAVGYAALIMYGLRTWWTGAVGTTALELSIDPVLLVAGVVGALVASIVALFLSFRRLVRLTPRALITGGLEEESITHAARGRSSLAAGLVVIAGVLVGIAIAGAINQTAAFFGAGGLALIAGLVAFSAWLRPSAARPPQTSAPSAVTSVVRLGIDYSRWRPRRSMLSAALIAFAAFVLIAVGAFQRDAAGISLAPESGTGGYALMAEAVAPLLHNPNTTRGREEYGLTDPSIARATVTRFRLRPGDEASCLTLYRPTNPRIIAPEPSFATEPRFTFAASVAETDAERANPWLLLDRTFEDGAIAAIADMTSLTYVLHLEVGDDFEFKPDGLTPVRLRFVGALADSVFQSEVIIGEAAFTTLFPRQEGYRVWMVRTEDSDPRPLATMLERQLSDFGVDVIETRERLASYHAVENTYLATFQALGALGLLLGTAGLAAVLARNVLERRRELGLLAAVGFTRRHTRTMVLAESALLVGVGLALGTATALVAVAPALLERATPPPVLNLAMLLAAVAAVGLLAATIAVRVANRTPVLDALRGD